MARAASSRLSGRRPSVERCGRAYPHVGKQKSKQTRRRRNTRFSVEPLASSSRFVSQPENGIKFTFLRKVLRLTSTARSPIQATPLLPHFLFTVPSTSALPSRLSERCFSPQISGQYNEPAAPQAAEIRAEEANSSLPGIHIVAALQWDGLRQISSRRRKGWI